MIDTAPELFDRKGRLRPLADFSKEELAAMSEERAAKFYAAYEAGSDCEQVERAAAAAGAAVSEIAKRVDDLRKRLNTLRPSMTHYDLWRESVGKPPLRSPETPEQAAATAETERDLAAAEAELVGARERMLVAQRAIPAARKIVADTWAAYHAKFPRKNVTEAAKEHIAGQVRAREEAKHRQEPPRRYASVLDMHLQSGRGAPGIRSVRQAQRGAYPASVRGRQVQGPRGE